MNWEGILMLLPLALLMLTGLHLFVLPHATGGPPYRSGPLIPERSIP